MLAWQDWWYFVSVLEVQYVVHCIFGSEEEEEEDQKCTLKNVWAFMFDFGILFF